MGTAETGGRGKRIDTETIRIVDRLSTVCERGIYRYKCLLFPLL